MSTITSTRKPSGPMGKTISNIFLRAIKIARKGGSRARKRGEARALNYTYGKIRMASETVKGELGFSKYLL